LKTIRKGKFLNANRYFLPKITNKIKKFLSPETKVSAAKMLDYALTIASPIQFAKIVKKQENLYSVHIESKA
jgi:hypothetical protein